MGLDCTNSLRDVLMPEPGSTLMLEKSISVVSKIAHTSSSIWWSLLDRVFVEYVITWLWVRAGSNDIGFVCL